MFVHQTGQLTNPKYIINFPTKRHWKGKSRIEDIDSGLEDLVNVIKKYHIKSIAIPPLGSGLGGLDWQIVKQKIESSLKSLNDTKIIIFEPNELKTGKSISKSIPKMTAGRAALIELMDRYLDGLLDPFVTLLEVHKLVYFMQEAGEPLKLNFKKAKYGPYAQNLRHVLNAIEGHLLSGYEDGGDTPDKQLKLIPGAREDAKKFLKDKATTQKHFQKVADLVEGFETPFGLELLATVHWVIKTETIKSVDDALSSIYKWNSRKKQFTKRQIELAMNTLKEKNWIFLTEEGYCGVLN
jgi:O-acetyl-ADP-ribose deacetylase (regulator of RNase III)